MRAVQHEVRSGHKTEQPTARVAKSDMWRVFASLLIAVLASSTTFNAVTVAVPKLFAERLTDLTGPSDPYRKKARLPGGMLSLSLNTN